MTIKLVYYGPALSGKTTNLQVLHKCLVERSRGRLMTLNTADDRTLFFDVLPIFFEASNGLKLKLKLFTVPGQVMHAATRKIVLTGADGVVFVADSRLSEARANAEAWTGLKENLASTPSKDTPVVIQFNKRDLPDIRSDEDLAKLASMSEEPIFKSIAIRNQGVIESLLGLLCLTYRHLDAEHNFGETFKIEEREFLEKIAAQMTTANTPPFDLDAIIAHLSKTSANAPAGES